MRALSWPHEPADRRFLKEFLMRYCLAFLALGFLALTGCPMASTPVNAPVTNASNSTPEAEEAPVAGRRVTLKLPNMVCDGCAAAVEEGLRNVTGIENIKTDFTTHVCKFIVTDEALDWQAKLAELAQENSHLEDWSVVEGS
jgi:copper chaperone CopZ